MTNNGLRTVVGMTLLGLCAAVQGETVYQRDPQNGLESWGWHGDGASFTFTQRLPDQSRAYFQGRGLTPEAAEEVAMACVFQAIVRNDTDLSAPLELHLADWRVSDAAGRAQPLRLEAEWQQQWQRLALTQAARIAFRWSLFPSQQRFQPGDWNMGMVTFNRPPGSRFDLDIVWQQGDEPRQLRIEGMRCAPDQPI
ncbi:MAG: hypothetical protein OQL08_13325 [Gammaproteobacteria bacterium]|nr:hypothetical protein [Gammaproteobacteria bacterium]